MDFKETEKKMLEFWEKNKIYEKSKKNNSKGKKFYMMDGPPYANGHIHFGHALNKTLKDIAMRSKRIQGYDVFDRPGYDTHGVPIEFQVEKELGSRGKQDIEKYGVEKFINRCKEFATQYIGAMSKEFADLGIWMDWNNPYLTLNDEFIEAIWHAFKEADKKGLLYLGKYPVHICSRCETAVAFNEIVYEKQKDNSIFVKFALKKNENTKLIIWTTTPWTLPANTGVMVNPEVVYQEIEISTGEHWIIAKDLVPSLMAKLEMGFTPVKEFKGKEMKGWEYINPLSQHINLDLKNAYKVVLSARYVTTEDGTGLVHCAPGHGKEDYEVGREYGLDMPSPVGSNGILTNEAGKYSGKKAREVDSEIISDLESMGSLVYKMTYEHDYPLCWRDKTPLLMVAQPQWFLKVSQIQKEILKENEKVNWVPDWMKLRMKGWLEGISDWPVSRQRYWGTPLPIWYDSKSGEKIVIGSMKELQKLSGIKKIDMHKPGIDKIEIKTKSGKVLKRVPEVLDVWFDSGVSSWAALGYPSSDKKFKKYWPADLNIEGKDQVRGWWNSQFILSQITFGKKPFNSIMEHGMMLDLGKRKMSKSLGNVVAPSEVIEKFGRDLMRYYFAKLSKGEDFSYDENEFKDIQKFFITLMNLNSFTSQLKDNNSKLEIEDKWIISKYNSFINKSTQLYDAYKFPEFISLFEEFVVHDLSRTYVQMIRDRSDETYKIMNEMMIGIIKLLAPVMPLVTEGIWQELRLKKMVEDESIHLSSWPKFDKKKVNLELEKEFDLALRFIELGLAKRDEAKIGLRWPLGKATLNTNEKLMKEVLAIIAKQLNVKEVEIKKAKENSVSLDTKLTPELEGEGYARELARKIQAERKNAGLQKGDLITLRISLSKNLNNLLKNQLNFLKERTNSEKLEIVDENTLTDKKISFIVKEEKIVFDFRN
jgi:isoleucyl-tRNA synthetase